MVVDTAILDHGDLRNQHLDILDTNDLPLFNGGLENLFEDSTLTLCPTNLVGCFQSSKPQLNAMDPQEILHSTLVVHSTIASEELRCTIGL